MSDNLAHSKLGASSAKRWLNCTASIELYNKVPDLQTKYADEGTKAHTAAEKYIQGLNVPEGEAKENAKIYASTIWDAYAQAVNPGPIHYESRVQLKQLADNAFGTVDAWFYDYGADTLYVFDYKYGAGVFVKIEDNEQLKYYSLGIIETFNLFECQLIYTYIIQPRMENVSHWRYGIAELQKFLLSMALALVTPPIFMEGEHCRFCDAKPICPAKLKTISSIVGGEITTKLTANMLRSPSDMTEDEMFIALHNADLIRDWVNSVKGYAQNYISMGGSIPGYSLKQSMGNRKYVDEMEVIKAFGHLGDDKLYSKALRSPAQLEKLLPKELKQSLESLTTRELGSVKLEYTPPSSNAQTDQFVSFNTDNLI